jgi:hypothetical protein
METDAEIIEQFVRCFEKNSEQQPVHRQTSRDKLDSIYSKLRGRLPPLFEELLLTFRWAGVDLERFYLFANPLGDDLSGFENEIFKDHGLSSVLIEGGFIQFGKAEEFSNYDPICFNTRKRLKDGDCLIVQLDHEEILCNFRLKEVTQVSSFFSRIC